MPESKQTTTKRPYRYRRPNAKKTAQPVKIMPLGGLDEIGKNVTLYEYGDDMFLVDCGLAFPDSEMLGVDIVIPDFSYLLKNADKIRGVVITHGHEDHIGSLPYLLKSLNVPVYGTKLTLGIISGKLSEHGLVREASLNIVKPGDTITLGAFTIEFIHVNHSIPGATSLAIRCGAGIVVQTGDFKIDPSPINGEIIDLARFSALGKEGVLLMLSDSTNAERPGYAMSESKVGQSFETLFKRAENKRLIIASFSSNIHRVQQIFDIAVRHKRKVALSGRSMLNVVSIGLELGYLTVPDGVLIDIGLIHRYPPEQVVIITTGSQGEPMSALYRMAFSDHRKVEVGPGDLIIVSATPVPGNEKLVSRVINELMKLGANVIYEKMYEVHVSGHACQEELKLLLGLVKPKYFMPVHGEQRHLIKHAELAESMGIPKNNILVAGNGRVVEVGDSEIKVTGTVPAGSVMVDGLGVGDVGSIVLRDRKHLAEDGLIVAVMTIDKVSGECIAGPELVSRGFVYVREAEELMDEARDLIRDVLDACVDRNIRDWSSIKTRIRDELSGLLYERTKRNPMILPVIMEA